MMHKNVAYNGLRFFVVIRVGGEGFRVVENVVLCARNYIEARDFLVKNTPSLRAAKIFKNISMIIVKDNFCQIIVVQTNERIAK